MNISANIFDGTISRINYLLCLKVSVKYWEHEHPLPNVPERHNPPHDYPIKRPGFPIGDVLIYPLGLVFIAYIPSMIFFLENWITATLAISLILSFIIVSFGYLKDYKKYRLRKQDKKLKYNQYLKALENYAVKEKKFKIEWKKTMDLWKSDPGYFTDEEVNTELKILIKQLYSSKDDFSAIQVKKFNNIIQRFPVSGIDEIIFSTQISSQNSDGYKEKKISNSGMITNLDSQKKQNFLNLLKKVKEIQDSQMDFNSKTQEIKRILWSEQTASAKLWIGAILGSITGFAVFGTGGVGIAALGGGIGIWGFLAGTTGGVLISSLLQNFESSTDRKK